MVLTPIPRSEAARIPVHSSTTTAGRATGCTVEFCDARVALLSVQGLTNNDHRDANGEESHSFTVHATHDQLSVHEPQEGVGSHENHGSRGRHLFRHSEEESENGESADVDTAGRQQTKAPDTEECKSNMMYKQNDTGTRNEKGAYPSLGVLSGCTPN